MEKDFFISYNRADRMWAEWIAWQLEGAGYTTVLQAWDFRPGGNFALQMQEASARSERTVAVLSPDYLRSGFAASEWAEAFAEDPTGEKGLLLPVRVRDCEPEGLLSQIVYVDLVGLDTTTAREALLAGVKRGRARPSVEPGFPGRADSSVHKRPSFPGTPDDSHSTTGSDADLRVESEAITTELRSDSPVVQRVPQVDRTEPKSFPALARSAWRHFPTIGKAVLATITALASLIPVLAALDVLPENPDSAPVETPESSSLSATLSDVTLTDVGISLGDYCERRELPCPEYDQSDRARPGHVFSYTIETSGYEGEGLRIRWSLYDAGTQQRVAEPTQVHQEAWPDGVYTPFAANDRNSGEIWIPLPATSGTFFLRMEVYPPDGARLDWADSETFRVSWRDGSGKM